MEHNLLGSSVVKEKFSEFIGNLLKLEDSNKDILDPKTNNLWREFVAELINKSQSESIANALKGLSEKTSSSNSTQLKNSIMEFLEIIQEDLLDSEVLSLYYSLNKYFIYDVTLNSYFAKVYIERGNKQAFQTIIDDFSHSDDSKLTTLLLEKISDNSKVVSLVSFAPLETLLLLAKLRVHVLARAVSRLRIYVVEQDYVRYHWLTKSIEEIGIAQYVTVLNGDPARNKNESHPSNLVYLTAEIVSFSPDMVIISSTLAEKDYVINVLSTFCKIPVAMLDLSNQLCEKIDIIGESFEKVHPSFEVVPCTICGSSSSEVTIDKDIVKCNNCGFVYCKRRMTLRGMEEYYSSVYAVNDDSAAITVKVPSSKVVVDTTEEYESSMRKDLFSDAVALFGKEIGDKTFVDIGCGWGGLLYYAKQMGMKTIGFEFTEPNVLFGKNELGLDIRSEQFTESTVPINSVAIITMSHVLEHVPFPKDFVKKIFDSLEVGGIFYVVVPNFESLCSTVLGIEWSWMEKDWHYSQFSPSSVGLLLETTGFEIVKRETRSGDFGELLPLHVLHTMYPQKSQSELRLVLKELNNLGRGEEIVIVGKKNKSSCEMQPVVAQKSSNKTHKTKSLVWVKYDDIGDVILSLKPLKLISERFWDHNIIVLCKNSTSKIFSTLDFVDHVFEVEYSPFFMNDSHQTAERINQYNPVLVLNPCYSRIGVIDGIVGLVNAERKIGFDGDSLNVASETDRLFNNRVYTELIKTEPFGESEFTHYITFLKYLDIEVVELIPQFDIPHTDREFADRVFLENDLDENKTLILMAGAKSSMREYEHFDVAIKTFVEVNGFSVVAVGSDDQYNLSQKQLSGLATKTVNLCGKTSILQLAGILKKARVAVGVESGPAHLSLAVGTQTVVVIGGGHFGRFMPYSNLLSLVVLPMRCFNCDWKCKFEKTLCISSISPMIIEQALFDAVAQRSEKSRIYSQSDSIWCGISPIFDKINIKTEYQLDSEIIEMSSKQSRVHRELATKSIYKGWGELERMVNTVDNGEIQLACVNGLRHVSENKEYGSFQQNELSSYALFAVKEPTVSLLLSVYFENLGKHYIAAEFVKRTMDLGLNTTVVLKRFLDLTFKANMYSLTYLFLSQSKKNFPTLDVARIKNVYQNIGRIKTETEMHVLPFDTFIDDIDLNIQFEEIVFSIILPSKSRSESLKRMLESLELAIVNIPYEIVFIFSEDPDQEMLNLVEPIKYKQIFTDSDFFEEGELFSWSKLMRKGFEKARGEWLMYGSDDIVFYPFAFNNAIQCVGTLKNVGGISFVHKNTLEDYNGYFKDYGYEKINNYSFINFGLLNKTAYKKSMGFNDDIRFYWGDVDICWKIQKAGFRFIESNHSLVDHENISDTVKKSNINQTFKGDTLTFYRTWFNDLLKTKYLIKKERFFFQEYYVNISKTKLIEKAEKLFPNNALLSEMRKKINSYSLELNEKRSEIQLSAHYEMVKVSAIVSVYNSERFIAGCIEDLLNQTLYKKGGLEIIIVNTGSEQNEESIVKDYQNRYSKIKYIKTEDRKTVYQAWNLGIAASEGDFITNANSDDRHREDALEIMCVVLDNFDCELVYSNYFVTREENAVQREIKDLPIKSNLIFDDILINFSCFIGPQPMWRKRVHDKVGYFSEEFVTSGDWEMWVRIAKCGSFIHINDVLGLYLESEQSVEHRNAEKKNSENNLIISRYLTSLTESTILLNVVYAGIVLRRNFLGAFSLFAFENIVYSILIGRNKVLKDSEIGQIQNEVSVGIKKITQYISAKQYHESLRDIYMLKELVSNRLKVETETRAQLLYSLDLIESQVCVLLNDFSRARELAAEAVRKFQTIESVMNYSKLLTLNNRKDLAAQSLRKVVSLQLNDPVHHALLEL